MTLPIFENILYGLLHSFASFRPLLVMLIVAGIILLVAAAGWTTQFAFVLMAGAIFMLSWAGIATYGMIGFVVIILAFILMASLWYLYVR